MLRKMLNLLRFNRASAPAAPTNNEWFQHMAKSYPNGAKKPYVLPAFPDEKLQRDTVGTSGIDALVQAFQFYTSVKESLEKHSAPIPSNGTIIDFGCGWGRIGRFFLREVGINNLIGLDVDQGFVDICKASFRTENFKKINPFPPVNLPDRCCSLVIAYSVFSHLSEVAFKAWMEEFRRILRPGGSIAITARHRNFFDYCESLKDADQSYQRALSVMFDDFDEARRQYDMGNFVFSAARGVTGGGSMDGSFYGEAFIPESYAVDLAKSMGFKNVLTIPPHDRVDQQTYIFFKGQARLP